MVITLSTVLHLPNTWFFVAYLRMEIRGLGIAMLITNFINFSCQLTMLLTDHDIKEAIIIPDKRLFNDLFEYFRLAFPNILVNIVQWGQWEEMTLASGLLGYQKQAS